MGFSINDKAMGARLNHYLSKAKEEEADAVEKIASGSVFTEQDPRPADRAISDSMEQRLRSLSASKKNVNDGVSLFQTADGAMSEISQMIMRMKEINLSATSSSINDQERRFLFIEFEALRDEVSRVAQTTEFNGIPLLYGQSEKIPENLSFRVDDPHLGTDAGGNEVDLNVIELVNLKSADLTPTALGIKSARDLLAETNEVDGISQEDALDLMTADDSDAFESAYDQAFSVLSSQRAIFGAFESRLQRVRDYIDVYQENISAAKSKISDSDYAVEVARMLQSRITSQANTALLSQNNVNSQFLLQLL